MTAHATSPGIPARSRFRVFLALALSAALAIPVAGLGIAAPAAAVEGVTLSGLQVENKTEPIGIDIEKPRFSWIIESDARGVVQESYRLRISENADLSDAWDSGVVDSAESSLVEYDGPQFASATRYYWSVDVVTNAGVASAASEFRSGLYNADADWAGSEWIGNDRVQETGPIEMDLEGASWIHPPYTGANTPPGYFRKAFTLDAGKTIESAEFVMTGDRGFTAFLNGTQVATGASVDDAWKRAARVQVSPLAGANLFAVRLNNTAKAYGAIVGKLTVLYTDGSTQDIVTDAAWLSSQTATTGWDANGYATTGWVAAAARATYGAGPWGEQVTVPAAAAPDTSLNFDTASWITPPIGTTSASNPVPSSLFRRTITVPAGKQVEWAQLAASGDQRFSAYFNGEKVAEGTGADNEWQTAKVVNVTPVEGDNVLAFSLTTTNGQYAGILARLRIGYTDGTTSDYVSNSGTRSLIATEATAPAGWNTVGFDDSAWSNAQAQALYRGWVYGDRVRIPALSIGTETLTFAGTPWIWTPEASTGSAPGEDRAFRSTRVTPAGTTAETADILITADDSYRLWVNGALIGATEGAVNEWQQSHLYEGVSLEDASNVFAVRTTNGAGSAAGLIAKIRIHYADGTSAIVTTGTDWKASKTIDAGFQQPGFDDSAWGAAVQQAVYGSGPWGSGVRAPVPTPNAAPLLRKEFAVDGDVETATLFLAAGGYADVTLNGSRISDDMLSPGFTDYDDTVQYIATDLTDQVRAGENAIGMELGRGFYGMTGSNVWNWQSPPWHDEPVVRAVLHLEYADGETEDIVTDDSWTIHDGPTIFDDLYGGDSYDAGRVQEGFDTVGFDDSGWTASSEVRGPKGVLVNQPQQPIRVTEELPAASITEPVDGTYVVKFPRVLAGNVRFTVAGEAGTNIRAQYGEKLLSSGLVNFSNNGGFGSGFQTDHFILAGTGEPESWAARFSYKGFQYIQVTGWPEGSAPTLDNFTALAVHTDADETGSFDSASDIMNRTHRAVVDTLKNNIHGIPTDTPMFEKNGWTGDAAVGAEMFMMNLDTHELFAKWMRDVNETRDAEGAPMVIAPSSGSWGEWGVAPPWHSAYVMIPRWLYQYGNDSRVMEAYYDGMKGYVDLEFGRTVNGIVADPRLGDWVSPEASPAGGNAPEDTRVSGTAYLYTMLTAMEQTATFLGHDDDAAEFAANAAETKDAFNRVFFDADKGYYRGNGDSGYRQTHNVLALAFGLAPDAEAADGVAASIVADIRAKGNKLNTGVLGTKYLLPVLTDYGYADVAYGLAVETAYPSWGYMVENGGTTMWEHWSLEARSLGHYFLGTVDDWFYHDVLGIQASETTGYRDLTIRPAVTGQLAWAKGSTQTPFGEVATDWSTTGGQLRLDVDVPVGSTATIHVPAANAWAVSEGGLPLDEVDGVTGYEVEGGDVVVTVGSGHYSFVSNAAVGEIGDVLALLDDIDGVITDLRDEGDINKSQQARLVQLVEAARAATLESFPAIRAGNATGAATKLAAVLAKLTAIDTAVTALDADDATKAALKSAVAKPRTELYGTITAFLGLTASVVLDHTGYKPGEGAVATVTLANAGTVPVTTVRASLAGLPAGFTATPSASVQLAASVAAGASVARTFAVAIPADEKPGSASARASLSYVFAGAVIRFATPFTLVVDSAVTVEAAVANPATVAPGGTANIVVDIRNAGKQSTTGRVELDLPSGWTPALPSETVPVGPGKTVRVSVPVFVPRDAASLTRTVDIEAAFASDGVTFGTATAELEVALAAEPVTAEGYDHIDLGNTASETAHGLTAAASSGTSSEAGLTRRYAGHLTPFSWFEFDAAVVEGEPFVVRAIETYDKVQTKRYKVYVDGEEVELRQYPHTTGVGTETFEFVVPAEFATSERVRIRFENQDDASFYDPSIADVWTQPLEDDGAAPQLVATLDPAAPNRVTSWFQQSAVAVALAATDNRDAAPAIDYAIDGGTPVAYAEPFSITGQGTHSVRYTATDAAGNVTTRTKTVKIDSVAPRTTIIPSTGFTGTRAKGSGLVRFTATDATSGIAANKYRLDGGAWKVGTKLTVRGVGKHTIEYASTDRAGNVEVSRTLAVTIVAK